MRQLHRFDDLLEVPGTWTAQAVHTKLLNRPAGPRTVKRAWTLLLALLIGLAGCLGAGGDEIGATNDTSDAGDRTGGDQNDALADGSGDDGGSSGTVDVSQRSLEAAPDWQIGEWWTIEMTSPLIGYDVTWTRVVAGTEGADFLLGQPQEEWVKDALLFHVPGLGEVAKDDLSYEVHDARFHVTDFPLTDGKEWETEFEGNPVTAQVTTDPDGTAEIWYCCGANITATYDPQLGVLSSFEAEGLISYEVVDHGFGYEGVVTVPHGHDLVFVNGRIASVLSLDQEPAPPIEEVELSSDYDRVTFAGIVGDILSGPPVGGAYREVATSPNGTSFETTRLPVEGAGLTVNVFETTEVGGTWSFEHAAAGPGIAFTEGIAYHVFDIRLPEGTLLGDHSEHITK